MIVSWEQATDLIQQGKIVGIPTETVYGLAASIQHEAAIHEIFSLKGRPTDNPLIVHGADLESLEPLIENEQSDWRKLAKNFWPGPLTIIVHANIEKVSVLARGGHPTVALRVPAHKQALQIIAQTGPIVAPSANLSGRPSPTQMQHVLDDFGDKVSVVDGGHCDHGLESTIIHYLDSSWQILRRGSISLEQLEQVLGYKPIQLNNTAIACPGQKYRHYAPTTPLILSARASSEQTALIIGFSGRVYPHAQRVLILGDLRSPEEIARNLYQVLRQVDHYKVLSAIVDFAFEPVGILATVAERLQRASLSFTDH